MTIMNTIDKIFSIAYQFFDQYRMSISILSGLVIISWIYNKFRVNRPFFSSKCSMNGKTVLITGGVSGIGYETAKDLLQRGARVILTDYNIEKGNQAMKQLSFETGCYVKNIRLMECDLRSFESVRKFAQFYIEEEKRLDVLICNAAVRSIDWSDGFTQFKNFRLWGAYPVSKAFMLLFTYKLRYDLDSNDVDVFAVNSSWVRTSIQSPMQDAIGFIPFMICYPILYILKFILAKTPKTGTRTSIFCAVEPSLRHSRDFYFEDCAIETVSSLCTNHTLANHLWKLSCEAVGI
ncbi:unnamed protein product [Rotaria sp. Silwood1]|nr:unnamed protein product [Rotaria sp. Silwood1]